MSETAAEGEMHTSAFSLIPSNRRSCPRGASGVFSHRQFNADWHDEWLPPVSHGLDHNSTKHCPYASVIADEVLCVSFSLFGLLSLFTFGPRCCSALNPFPRSISKHARCVTVTAFLALRTLSETPDALVQQCTLVALRFPSGLH